MIVLVMVNVIKLMVKENVLAMKALLDQIVVKNHVIIIVMIMVNVLMENVIVIQALQEIYVKI